MKNTYVFFDKRSGQILSVCHGIADANEARRAVQHHRKHHRPQDAKIDDEYVAIITVPHDAYQQGKVYRVDVNRQTLVVAEGEGGIGFGFAAKGRLS